MSRSRRFFVVPPVLPRLCPSRRHAHPLQRCSGENVSSPAVPGFPQHQQPLSARRTATLARPGVALSRVRGRPFARESRLHSTEVVRTLALRPEKSLPRASAVTPAAAKTRLSDRARRPPRRSRLLSVGLPRCPGPIPVLGWRGRVCSARARAQERLLFPSFTSTSRGLLHGALKGTVFGRTSDCARWSRQARLARAALSSLWPAIRSYAR
ncbi:hypothetical protein ERJ75_001097900 [Trypanosoma vivax]|nr:hypothetical protein TRVL_05547 [Trypanosoma vivax]KAH8610471.1 hypothetical protein ERJ75_001097900 [Trypanosoma vivax]